MKIFIPKPLVNMDRIVFVCGPKETKQTGDFKVGNAPGVVVPEGIRTASWSPRIDKGRRKVR